MNLTQNFTLEELTSSATARIRQIENTPDEKQMANLKKLCENVLQPIREKYGKPIRITSGFRCEKLNKAVGGASSSQHLTGEAADMVCDDNNRLWNLICKMILSGDIKVGQLIDEKQLSWIHISLPNGHNLNQILHA